MAPPWADFEFDPRRAAQTAKRTVNDGVQYASSLVARAAPFAQHAAVSAVAYTATLATVQARLLLSRHLPTLPVCWQHLHTGATAVGAPHLTLQNCLLPTQASAFALRVSCATPALAPAVGVLGITLASAVSGQASAAWGTYRREGPTSLEPKRWMARVQMDDLVLDAVLGAALFVVRGGW